LTFWSSLGLLVRLGYMHYCTSTERLLTGNLPVTWINSMRALILRWASHLDAAAVPLRTWLPSVYRWHDNWQRCVPPGPLVLRRAPLNALTPAPDMDRTVSRRSEPSSRTALMGEQPNPYRPRLR